MKTLFPGWLYGLLVAGLLTAGICALRMLGVHYARYCDPSVLPLELSAGEKEEADSGILEKWSYLSSSGERIPVLSIRPAGEGPFPAIVFLYGSGMSMNFGRRVEDIVVDAGFALYIPEQIGRGERRSPDPSPPRKVVDWWLRSWRLGPEARRLADALELREEVDRDRIYFWGGSFGVLFGARAMAADDRFRAGVFTLAAADFKRLVRDSPLRDRESPLLYPVAGMVAWLLKPLDPIYVVDRIAPRPLLLQNASADDLIPPSAATALREAAGETAEQRWYDMAHERIGTAEMRVLFADGLQWLRKTDDALTRVHE